MPAARGQSAEQRCLRGFAVQMKRLRIELRRERLDLRRINRVGAARKVLAHAEIVEKERAGNRFAAVVHLLARCNLHDDSYSLMLCQCSERALAGWFARLPAASSAWASGGAFSFCATRCMGSRVLINSRRVSGSRRTS